MSQKAPRKALGHGLGLVEITRMFPDDKIAERWFAEARWPERPRCPYCDSDKVQHPTAHKTMPYRCQSKGCRKRFSVKVGTIMASSKLGYRDWAIAAYLFVTNLKGVSSLKLCRDLGCTQKTAWHMAHRLREAWAKEGVAFTESVEVDEETHVGGEEKNNHGSKKLKAGPAAVDNTAVIGMKERKSNKVMATKRIESTERPTSKGIVPWRVSLGIKVYTDDHTSYHGLPNHQSVKHSVSEYVDGMDHSNGMENACGIGI